MKQKAAVDRAWVEAEAIGRAQLAKAKRTHDDDVAKHAERAEAEAVRREAVAAQKAKLEIQTLMQVHEPVLLPSLPPSRNISHAGL